MRTAGGLLSADGRGAPAVVITSSDGTIELTTAGPNVDLRAVYGSALDRSRKVIPETTTTDPLNPLTYLDLGSSGEPLTLADGTYRFDASATFSTSSTLTRVWYDLYAFGAPSVVGAAREAPDLANASIYRASWDVFIVTGGPIPAWFSLVFAKDGGSGSVTCKLANLALYRIA